MFKKYMAFFLMASLMVSTVAFGAMYEASEDKKDSKEHKAEAIAKQGGEEKRVNVKIDVKPDDALNMVDADRDKSVKVALVGSEDFDVNDVEFHSLTFQGVKGKGNCEVKDANNDGVDDLVCEFSTEDLQLDKGPAKMTLKGKTKDGKSFEGSDMVTVTKSVGQ